MIIFNSSRIWLLIVKCNLVLHNCLITSFTNTIKSIFKETNVYKNLRISNAELTVDNINFVFINFLTINDNSDSVFCLSLKKSIPLTSILYLICAIVVPIL